MAVTSSARGSALMPSKRELIDRFGTTKSTAAKAPALLQAEGLVGTETGRGTFVQDIPKVKRVRRIPPRGDGSGGTFAEEMRKAGLDSSTCRGPVGNRLPLASFSNRPSVAAAVASSGQVSLRRRPAGDWAGSGVDVHAERPARQLLDVASDGVG